MCKRCGGYDPEWKLTIAGRPGDLTVDDVSALVERAGLRGAVKSIASPTDATVKALMRSCSFLASASDYEGFGVAAIEGMSAGLIPLLSDIPPFRRLVARTGLGLIVDYSHPDVAARASAAEPGRGLRRTMRSNARPACRPPSPIDWRHVCQEYRQALRRGHGERW